MGNINHCEISIPETKQELKDHNAKLKIILNDIAVMTMILEMSDCDAKFLQYKKLAMLRCKDQCTNSSYVTFNHKSLQDRLSQLKSPASQKLMNDGFAEMFDDADSEEQD